MENIVGDLATNTFIVGDTRIKYNGEFIYNAEIENQKQKKLLIQSEKLMIHKLFWLVQNWRLCFRQYFGVREKARAWFLSTCELY